MPSTDERSSVINAATVVSQERARETVVVLCAPDILCTQNTGLSLDELDLHLPNRHRVVTARCAALFAGGELVN
jgi:hypothetical protein